MGWRGHLPAHRAMPFGGPWREFKNSTVVENNANWAQRIIKEEVAAGINEWHGDDGNDAAWVLPGGIPGKQHPALARTGTLKDLGRGARNDDAASELGSEISVGSNVTSKTAAESKIEYLRKQIADERLKRQNLQASLGIAQGR